MSAIPQPWPDLAQRLRKIEEQLRRLSNRSAFFGTGIHPTAGGGMESDSFDGDLATDNAGTTGWAFNDQKVALGETIFRPGSVGNDALTDPVVPGVVNFEASNFPMSTTETERSGVTVTVPAGCTRLLAHCTGSLYALNSNATGGSNGTGGDAIWARVKIGTQQGERYGEGISGGGFATGYAQFAALLEGLTPGATVRLSVLGSTAFQAMTADPGNQCAISGTLLWLR